MRVLALIALLLFALGAVLYWAARDRDSLPLSSPSPSASTPEAGSSSLLEEPRMPPTVEGTPSSPVPPAGRKAVQEGSVESRTDAASGLRSALCRLFGRVVDETGTGLEGVEVRFEVRGPWSKDNEGDLLDEHWDLHGFKLTTSSDGIFSQETPLPDTYYVGLYISLDPFHTEVRQSHGGNGVDNEPPIRLGDNDLGTFVLSSAGTLFGRVEDTAGRPIDGANVRLGGSIATTYGHKTESDAAGRYIIEHVPPGSYGVIAKAERYQNVFLTPFSVAAGRANKGPDFELDEAPTLSGRVVDGSGQPLEGARLSAAGARATSGPDGAFTIYLPYAEPSTLKVKLAGYKPFGEGYRFTPYEPGTSDLEIVLQRLSPDAHKTFVVIDAETREPIEQFGFGILSKAHMTGWMPVVEQHPGGIVEADARPGLDVYRVVAPGYLLRQGGIAKPQKQRIRLRSGTTIVGQLVSGNFGSSRPAIRIERGSIGRSWGHDGVERESFRPYWRGFKDRVSPRITTGEAGTFRIQGLSRGTYRLEVGDGDGPPLVLVPLEIRNEEILDLGELRAPAGSSIHGALKVVPGRSPAGWRIVRTHWGREEFIVADDRGRFRFDDVPPGIHELNVAEVPGVLAAGSSVTVSLGEGDEREIVLDLTDRGVCRATIHVLWNGQPAKGVYVTTQPVDKIDWLSPLGHLVVQDGMGTTDEKGRVSGWVRAVGESEILLLTESGLRIGPVGPTIPLFLDTEPEVTVDLEVGFLRIDIGQVVATRTEKLSFHISPMRGRHEPHWGWAQAEEENENFFDFGPLLTGDYLLRIERPPLGPELVEPEDWHNVVIEESSGIPYEREIRIEARETTTCVLTEGDRVDS